MRIVIKVGGSMCFDEDGPIFGYFSKLVPVLTHISKNNQLIVAVGGGKFIRKYYKSLEKFHLLPDQMELLAIDMLKANARLLAYLLKTNPIFSLDDIHAKTQGVISGIAPGRSTDANAALAASMIRADLFIKLTNVNGIYDMDPNKYPKAKLIRHMPFSDLEKYSMDGSPGSYGILDKLAMETIVKNKIRTIVISGEEPNKILDVIKGRQQGTLVFG